MALVNLAGLNDVVTVMVGSSDDALRRLHGENMATMIDLMFLDHYKPAYTTDLKLCEELKLIGPGSVLAADNVIKPGNPPYLEYVRSTIEEKRSVALREKNGTNMNGVDSRFQDGTANQYHRREGQGKLDTSLKGNPNLVYESNLVHSFEPSAVPVSMNYDCA